MILKEKNGLHWLEFELFAPFPQLIHGIFLRQGGVSLEPFASLNFSQFVGDSDEAVAANESLAAKALNLPKIARTWLYHGTDICIATHQNYRTALKGDALITKENDLALLMTHADCQTAIFFDPTQSLLALAHSGWRGSVQNIYGHLIRNLQSEHGCQPENIFAAIGPSLGPDSAEFINYRTELPEAFWDFRFGNCHFDFWAISEWQLTAAGILPHHLQIAKIDTFADEVNYFSYRRDKICGRNGTFAMLGS